MFDFKFDWKDDLSIGIDIVDEQHKEFLRIGRDIEQLVITNCIGVSTDRLYEIIRELREYVNYHFYEEEELMRRYGSIHYESHVQEHQKFLKIITNIDLPRMGQYPYQEMSKLKDVIKDWIFEHMLNTDAQMGKEIKDRIEYIKNHNDLNV